jgi:hypothetical protein
MKVPPRLLILLALSAAPIDGGFATQTAPWRETRKVHGSGGSKSGAVFQKKPGLSGGTSLTSHPLKARYTLREGEPKCACLRSRRKYCQRKGRCITAGVSKWRTLPNVTTGSPATIAATRNTGRISGTGALPNGTVSAIIRPIQWHGNNAQKLSPNCAFYRHGDASPIIVPNRVMALVSPDEEPRCGICRLVQLGTSSISARLEMAVCVVMAQPTRYVPS